MATIVHFTPPRFTAREVAHRIGMRLRRTLEFQEAIDEEYCEGMVKITAQVSVFVGADYLVVTGSAPNWDLLTWPRRPNLCWALTDLRTALKLCPSKCA